MVCWWAHLRPLVVWTLEIMTSKFCQSQFMRTVLNICCLHIGPSERFLAARNQSTPSAAGRPSSLQWRATAVTCGLWPWAAHQGRVRGMRTSWRYCRRRVANPAAELACLPWNSWRAQTHWHAASLSFPSPTQTQQWPIQPNRSKTEWMAACCCSPWMQILKVYLLLCSTRRKERDCLGFHEVWMLRKHQYSLFILISPFHCLMFSVVVEIFH